MSAFAGHYGDKGGETGETDEVDIEEVATSVELWLEDAYGPQTLEDIEAGLGSPDSFYEGREFKDITKAVRYSDEIRNDFRFGEDGEIVSAYSLRDFI